MTEMPTTETGEPAEYGADSIKVLKGLDAVLTRKKCETPPIPAIFDGERQAKLTALACSEPPPGHARWTIRLLAQHVFERNIVPAAHYNTVGRALKKTISNRT